MMVTGFSLICEEHGRQCEAQCCSSSACDPKGRVAFYTNDDTN